MKHLLRYAALSLLLLLPACQSTGPSSGTNRFPTPGADWSTSIGQLRYVNPQRSVIGEAIVSRHGADQFQLDFLTGPGVPLIRLRESGSVALAEGIFARGSWRGNANGGGRLGSWTALRAVFTALEKQPGARPVAGSAAGSPLVWTAKGERAGDTLVRVEVTYPSRKERFIFVFAR